MLRLRQTLLVQQQLTASISLKKQALRTFSMFNKSTTSNKAAVEQQQQQHFNSQSESRTQEDIIRSIDGYRASIRSKTQHGQSLSRNIADSVEVDKHMKLQRYEVFIDKMQRLYKSEVRFQQKQKKKLQLQKNALFQSITPLKDILRQYQTLTHRGFNSEATAETLANIASVLRARGQKGRVQGDYTDSELDQSIRMQKLIDDLKYALKPEEFFSAPHFAKVCTGLGEIGYKNTGLIPLIFEKLNHQLDERQLGLRHQASELNFQDAVYGGPRGFVARHYVFKGFQDSSEFNEYLSILMDWESNAPNAEVTQTQQQLNEQAQDVQRSMGDIINAAVQVKELQKEYQGSIDSLRQQYFQMTEAADKHAFLQENQYLKYDLLELQELLVKGGYLEPEEASSTTLANEPFDQRMQRASDVFYDYVVNYAPELLSPQHANFYEAATKNDLKKETVTNYLEENQNQISLKTLSQSLIGLSEQALSIRRDVLGQDYLNKFYEDYLMPTEKKQFSNDLKGLEKFKTDAVLMERGYLKAWQLFKQHSSQILPRVAQIVKEERGSLEGQLYAFGALNACRVEEREVRKDILGYAVKNLSQEIDAASVVAGLKGLAESPASFITAHADQVRQLSKNLAARINPSTLTFPEQVDALWSLCALQLYESAAPLVKVVNALSFERLDNDLKHSEYVKLLDIHNALKFEAPRQHMLQLTNKGLLEGLDGHNLYLNMRFKESQAKYDPFKQRVVQALSKGLTNASVDHQVIMENELFQQQTLDADILNAERYPYKPDIVMGYKGQKVGVFVLPETSTTRDTHQADGAHTFRQRLLERAAGNIKTASIAVDEVVKYDIEKLQLDINADFSFPQKLESQIGAPQTREADFTSFSEFGAKFISKAADFIEQQSHHDAKEVQRLDTLVQRLYQALQMKQAVELRFEPVQRASGYEELRFQLMKLSLLYDTLGQSSREFVDAQAQPRANDFKGLLQGTLGSLPRVEAQEGEVPSWVGTRLEVELPVMNDSGIRKSIVPEMLNQRFMWVDDYFHYDDWKTKQQATFDNFNLLVLPTPSPLHSKYFFDRDLHSRRVPQGIFPYPNHKRQLMLPSANQTVVDVLKRQGGDEYVQFEKEPEKMMVIEELKKSEQLKAIDEEVSMITNLQNLKQGLKSDYSDKEILNNIMLNLSFTEQLIEEHLGKTSKKESNVAKLVERDAGKFRRFVESTYYSKDREDPYTHFYLKEARGKEQMKVMIEQDKQLQRETDSIADAGQIEERVQKQQALRDKIEDLLLSQEQRDEDLLDLSSSLRTQVNKVNYDLSTLVKSEFVYDVEPELIDKSLSDEEYLAQVRLRAEAKLIKMKIVYKANQNVELTANEKQYLKQWIGELRSGKSRNLLNLRDTMVPKSHTKLTIGDIEAKALYSLNSISRVSFERERHGEFSLSDLIVELSHFLDEEVVNKVETEVFSERLRSEWGLSKSFKVVETRNKEINLVLNELEEVAWRSAGQLEERDFDHLKAMLSVKRNKDYFDRHFYENDMQSFRNFFESANQFDDRLALVERWLVRKEDEFKSRVVRPPKHLQKTDQELHVQIDAQFKVARERLVSKMLIADEYGNPIDKSYKDLTSNELHTLTENLCLRMYLFNYEYPAFVPHVVRAVMEHPSLLKSDQTQMDTYCRMFELDWRGDRSYTNKQQFMSNSPIYLDGSNLKSQGEITSEVVKDRLQRACAPYVEETAKRLISLA